jgi:hypothetical protein
MSGNLDTDVLKTGHELRIAPKRNLRQKWGMRTFYIGVLATVLSAFTFFGAGTIADSSLTELMTAKQNPSVYSPEDIARYRRHLRTSAKVTAYAGCAAALGVITAGIGVIIDKSGEKAYLNP